VIHHDRGYMALRGGLPAALLLLLFGCGGGGGPKGIMTGFVSDIDGTGIAGATVSVGTRSTTSLSNGTFTLQDISDGLRTVRAQITINGHRWSGETQVDFVSSGQNRSVNVVVSDERDQGGIGGRVIGPDGGGLPGAKVFVNVKFSPQNGSPYTLASTLVLTDNDGYYEVDKLTPNVNYIVTASLAGFINQTRENVLVSPNSVTTASFALASSGSLGPIPAPQGLFAQAWTVQTDVSRADSRTKSVYEWLKHHYRQKAGLPDGPQARHIERKTTGRFTPAGSVAEVDLFWDYAQYDDMFGYLIKRGTSANQLADTAVLRDPLAGLFFDADPALTPDVVYYYTVHRLDTIQFPQDGTVGPASDTVSAQPFLPIRATGPGQGQTVSGNPLFRWTQVSGASAYQIYLWDSFPDLTNPNDPNSAHRIWPADLNNPGSSLVIGGNNTQQAYDGPVLSHGTYYWLVVALDSSSAPKTFSASQIARFTEQ
jgi:hypothetical protein